MAVVPALAVGTAALALGAFVVVLGSGPASPATTPTFNVDALPAAAQDYVPYLENGGLVCDDVDAALLATLPELLYSADMARAATYNSSPMILAAAIYLIILWPAVRLVSRLEHRIAS